jgi:hypothetical protein
MNNQNCKLCGRELKPAPAKWNGEPTYVGYYPCPCNESYMTETGIIKPHTPEHEMLLKEYDKLNQINNEKNN